MGSWMEPNIHREHGGRISKELAEQLGVFDTATGLRRKPDGSLEILWPSDTPKEKEIVNHLGVEDVGGQLLLFILTGLGIRSLILMRRDNICIISWATM